MNYRPLPDNTKLEILDALASGRTPRAVATDLALDPTIVSRVASAHGYPDLTKIAWAANVTRNGETTTTPDGTPRVSPTPATVTRPPSTATLLERGRTSTRKTTQALAARITGQLERLARVLDDEARLDAERAAKKAAKQEALAEVRRLEKQLAAARARARNVSASTPRGSTSPYTGSAAQRADVPSKVIRAWAAQNNIDCPKVGRIPARIVDAYLAAHRAA